MAGLAELQTSAFDRGEELTKGVPKGSKKGDFKKVFKAKYKSNNTECVLQKLMKNDAPNAETNFPQQWAARELEILEHLGKLGHQQYIPEIFGICREKDGTGFLQESITIGALKVALKDEKKAGITGLHKVYMAKQIAAGMAFLEQARVLHNDLSCKNVVVTKIQAGSAKDTLVKIDNFKFGILLPEGELSTKKRQGCALRWISPETLVDNKMSFKSNVWMLGATLWEMFSAGNQPWQKIEKNDDVKTRLKAMAAGENADLTGDFPQAADCPDLAQAALLSCMAANEQERPDFMQVQSVFMQMVAEAEGTAVPDSAGDGKAPGGMAAPTPSTNAPMSRDDTPQRNSLGLGPEQIERLRSMGGEAEMMAGGGQPWTGSPGVGGGEEGTDAYAARFKTIKQFLRSDRANQALGPQVVYSMRQEIEEAQAREAYLMDLVKRMQDQMGEWYGPQIPQNVNGSGTDGADAAAGANSASMSILQAKGARSRGAFSPSRTSLSGGLSNEHLASMASPGGCAASGGANPPWSASGVWTLWSFVGPALPPQRQDFQSMNEATAAFEGCKAQGNPCMLRDPSGNAHAKYNWVAFNFTLPPRLAPPAPNRAGSPGPPVRPGSCPRSNWGSS